MKNFNSKILICLFFLFFSTGARAQEITVAVAASVQFPFEELQAEFQRETGVNVKSVIGSSGKLTTQIENGAPFDIFLSADTDYPQALQKEGLTYNPPKIYGYGTLVLWTLAGDLDLSKGVPGLVAHWAHKVAIANPATAPYGRQAVNALKHFKIYKQVSSKLVYGESIAQVNQFVTSKAADVGFTAKSVVLAPNVKDQGKWFEVEKEAYEPIAQAAVILKYAEEKNLAPAQKFFDFLFSPAAQGIFKKYGYTVPEEGLKNE